MDLRFRQKVSGVEVDEKGARLTVESPDGTYRIESDWLVVADGARSPIRRHLGLDIEGRVFQDRFLIADVIMKADFPAERWFWFDPPFHPNQSVLLHREADDVYRIDFQLGWMRILKKRESLRGSFREYARCWAMSASSRSNG